MAVTSWVLFEMFVMSRYDKSVYCHPPYLNYMQSTSCEMSGWMKQKLELRLPGEISIKSDTQMTSTPMAKSKELKRPLMKVKEENEKAGLKLNTQKTNIMSSGPITSW